MAAWTVVNLEDKPYMRLIAFNPADFALISGVRGIRWRYVVGTVKKKGENLFFFVVFKT